MTRRLFDAHLHIIDARFPLVPNQGFVPEPFTCADYLSRMAGHELLGGVLVSGSFQGMDTTWLLDALRILGPGYVGVVQLLPTASDAQIRALADAGVRGVRINLRRGGTVDLAALEALAWRVHALAGWHVEIYADAAELAPMLPVLAALPRLSIDHLGLSKAGLPTLRSLVAQGVRVKATGFGRVDFDVAAALRELHAEDPAALMFGTDLPSTRAPRAYRDEDYDLVLDALGVTGAAQVLWQNACSFYRIEAEPPGST